MFMLSNTQIKNPAICSIAWDGIWHQWPQSGFSHFLCFPLHIWCCIVLWMYAKGFFEKILKSIPHLLIAARIQHGYCLNIFFLKGHLSPEIRSLTVLASLWGSQIARGRLHRGPMLRAYVGRTKLTGEMRELSAGAVGSLEPKPSSVVQGAIWVTPVSPQPLGFLLPRGLFSPSP